MRNARRRMLLLVGMIASGSSASAQKVKIIAAEPVDQKLTRLLASKALAPLREPDRVEALPIGTAGAGLSSTSQVIEQPVVLGPKTAQALRQALVNPDSYGGMTACMFDPGVAFRFVRGSQSVQLQVCFMCGEVIFETKSGQSLTRKMFIMPEVRAKLLAAARRAFPKDQALQGLPD